MSLRDVITKFETASSYTVTRRAAGTRVKGVYTEGASSTFEIDAVVVPLNGDEIRALPEAYHQEELRNVYTTTELRASDTAPDSISIGGVDYRAFRVERWDAWGDTHYIVTVAKEVK